MRRVALTTTLAIVLLAWPGVAALAADPTVQAVSQSTDVNFFKPKTVFIMPGHTVHWHNQSGKHNVCFGSTANCIGGSPVKQMPSNTHWDAKRTFSSGTFKY